MEKISQTLLRGVQGKDERGLQNENFYKIPGILLHLVVGFFTMYVTS